MEILWWWAPAGVATLVAVAWAARAGHRDRAAETARRSGSAEELAAAEQRRLAEALSRPLPSPAVTVRRPREASTGVALRPDSAATTPDRPGRRA